MAPKTAIEIARLIINPLETMDAGYRTVEINGLYKRIVFVDTIILYTETQDQEGNWYDVKNYYRFQEGSFDLNHYNEWEKRIIGSVP